jgi:hypothetical protein
VTTGLALALAGAALASTPAAVSIDGPPLRGPESVVSITVGTDLVAGVPDPVDLDPAELAAPPPLDDVRWHQLLTRLDLLEARLAELEQPVQRPTQPRVLAAGSDENAIAISETGPVVVSADQVVSEALSLTGPVDVYGHVLGNAVGMGADVRVHPGGRVDGDAVSLGGTVQVLDGGVVSGDRVALGDGALTAGGRAAIGAPSLRQLAMVEHVRDVARRFAILLSFAGAGVLVVGVWPAQVSQVSRIVGQRPFWYGLAGTILAGLLMGGALVLALTVIGIPLSMLLLMALSAGGLLGYVGLSQAIGDLFPPIRRKGPWVAFLVGVSLLTAVAFLPYVGPVIVALVGLPALGAALISRFGNRPEESPL